MKTYLISVYDLASCQVIGTNEFQADKKAALKTYQETIDLLVGKDLKIALFELNGNTWKGLKKHEKRN